MLKRILTALMLLVVVFATLLGLRQVYVELADLVGVLICGLGVFEMANAFKKARYQGEFAFCKRCDLSFDNSF